jgi:hypothetical protein
MANTRELSQLASVISVADETRNVGIGTTNPTSKLHVSGDVRVSGVVTSSSFRGDGSQLTGIVSGIGIHSNGVVVGSGATILNFVGTGNTFVVTNNKIDISISGGSQVSVGTASPASPSSGNLWYNTNLGRTFIYYNDGDSSQWVDAAPFNIVSDSSSAASVSIGTESPVGPTSGDLWYNADYARIFVYYDNGINSQWVDAAPFNYADARSVYADNAGISTFSTSAGISTSVIGGIGSITQLQVTGISTFTNGPILVGTGTSTGTASQRLQVTGGAYVSGNLGIGTTNPQSKLHVVGDVRVSGVVTATDFNSTSDINLKENIKPIEDSLNKIIQLNGIEFDWKYNQQPSIGVIAQEVEKVFPSIVKTAENKSVNYNGLIGVLIEAVKEQQKQIEELNTSQNGFTSGIGVTNPVKIAVSGNTLTFTVVGVGSTSLRLY